SQQQRDARVHRALVPDLCQLERGVERAGVHEGSARAVHVIQPSATREVVPGDERLAGSVVHADPRYGGGLGCAGEKEDGDEAGEDGTDRQSGSQHSRGALMAEIPTLNPSLAGALQSANNFPPWPTPIGGEGGPRFGPAKLKSGEPN